MKKTFLLLLSIGALTSVFAQGDRSYNEKDLAFDRNNHQPVYNNNPVYNDSHGAYVDYRKRDEEIAKVTWDYNRKMDAVQHDRHLRGREKGYEISRLQREKADAIRAINERFENSGWLYRR